MEILFHVIKSLAGCNFAYHAMCSVSVRIMSCEILKYFTLTRKSSVLPSRDGPLSKVVHSEEILLANKYLVSGNMSRNHTHN